MKVLVELFDECQIENAVAGLSLKPEKIIFVGFKKLMKENKINALKKLFKTQGIKTDIECGYVSRYDFDSIAESLNAIVERNPDCCFDITGGKEPVLVAIGKISAERSIPVIQFDVKSGSMIRVSNCEGSYNEENASISIDECISLSGGTKVYESPLDFKWDMNKDFCRDIELLWSISRKDSSMWNRNSVALGAMEKAGIMNESLYVDGNIGQSTAIVPVEEVMVELEKAGMIKDYTYKNGHISFKYKNRQIHACLSKAGNILELYAYMIVSEIAKENPGFYTDIDVSVIADWDGEIDDEKADTRNEIDLLLMRNLIPVFISCKNGIVQKEALYELQSVSERFGGEYAKKVLLATYINKNAEAREFLLQRARDMNIQVIADIDKISREEFKRKLINMAR